MSNRSRYSLKYSIFKLYRYFNYVIAGYIVYILLLPFITPVMQRLMPALWQCAYKRISGRPCPLCGITRDLTGMMMRGSTAKQINPLSLYILTLLILNLALRLYLLSGYEKSSPAAKRATITTDILFHSIAAVTLAAYIILKRQ